MVGSAAVSAYPGVPGLAPEEGGVWEPPVLNEATAPCDW